MEPLQPERILDDLKGVIRGELLFDDLSRHLYSTDASLFELLPLGVVLPRDEEDLQALVRYAGEHQIPLIPRGAGTGVAGESLGMGIVVDLSKHFRAILEMGTDTVRVQPGVVLRELSQRLAKNGRRFAPDPAHQECTLGGMLATNASGARAFKHGYTRDHVDQLRVVLDSGDVAVAGWHGRWSAAETPHGRLEDIVSSVIALLQENVELLTSDLPRTRFNRCGYLLHDVLREDALNLARLLVGSEGTLAFFTEATLRTIPLPGGRALVLLGFASIEAALRAAQFALPSGPAACELIDRRLLTLSRGNAAVAALIPPITEAVLLIEYEADTQMEATAAALALADRLQAPGSARAGRARGRRYRRHGTALAGARSGLAQLVRPARHRSAVGVRGGHRRAPESLAKFLHAVQDVLHKHETTASYLIHAATGQVHIRPFLDLHRREDVARLWPLADDLYTVVLAFGGTISAQHGTGLARTPWVSKQYLHLYPVFKRLKAIFDPRHLLNPGKIVGPAPGMPAWPLRNFETKSPGVEGAEDAPQLRWQPSEMAEESRNCNGCGQCRIEAAPQRMCPIFRATHTEAATPRAKANLMRQLLALRERSAFAFFRGSARGRGFVRQLQNVRDRVSGPRQHSQAHAGGEGCPCRSAWSRPHRLGAGAHRIICPPRQRSVALGQWHARQSNLALAA